MHRHRLPMVLILVGAAAVSYGKNTDTTAFLHAGDIVPDFSLYDFDGVEHSLRKYLDSDKIIVIQWFNPTCTFIQKYQDTGVIDRYHKDAEQLGVRWLAINSGCETHPSASPELNAQFAECWATEIPILLDPDGTVGMAYTARATPEVFIIDTNGVLRYRGALDDSPETGGEEATESYVLNALHSLSTGNDVDRTHARGAACGVKYCVNR